MATLTIRDLDDELKRSLRMRAASRNRSMEEEARQILRAALQAEPAPAAGLAERIRARFKGLGDVALPLPPREPVRPVPELQRLAPPPARARSKKAAGPRR
jgi:antitoxin FitA